MAYDVISFEDLTGAVEQDLLARSTSSPHLRAEAEEDVARAVKPAA